MVIYNLQMKDIYMHEIKGFFVLCLHLQLWGKREEDGDGKKQHTSLNMA